MKPYRLFCAKEQFGLCKQIHEMLPNTTELGTIQWRTFPDGFPNLFIDDADTLKKQHCVFLASFHSPAVMFEQLSVIYHLPKLRPKSFCVVLPFFPVGTMERITQNGEIATAATLASLMSQIPSARGPSVVSIFDIHALPNRFFFHDPIQIDLRSAMPLLLKRLNELSMSTNSLTDASVANEVSPSSSTSTSRFNIAFPDDVRMFLTLCRVVR